jgi:hypothetical protein
MFNFKQALRALVLSSYIALFMAAHVAPAYGQGGNFTLSPSPLQPSAGVDPGGYATSILTLTAVTGFTSPVALSCVATSTQFTTDLPTCTVSPSSQTPPATPSITVTTPTSIAAGQYTITITGTSGSETETATLFLEVVEQGAQSYTLSVTKSVSPSSVTAGSGATATVAVNPIASYAGSVTLSCFSISPVVAAAPICSFNPATVAVASGAAPTSILTISTYGKTGTGKLASPRIYYAFWLGFPAIALAGIGASGRHRKKMLGAFLLMTVAASLLFLPACGSSSNNGTSNNASGLVTPKNTYTFALTATDATGVTPSNSTSTTSQATVTLTVN